MFDYKKSCITTATEFEASGSEDLVINATVLDFKDKIDKYTWEIKTSLKYDSKVVSASLLKGVHLDKA